MEEAHRKLEVEEEAVHPKLGVVVEVEDLDFLNWVVEVNRESLNWVEVEASLESLS